MKQVLSENNNSSSHADTSINDPVSIADNNQPNQNAYQDKKYRYYVLAILTLIYIFSFVDRQIVNILGKYIIEDLNLSDAQFGMLSGIAFAAIYVTCGIPLARWADVGSRRNVITVSLTVWSGMTALCGYAQNFWQMFLFRAGVGVGEAGGSPAAHSMVSDIFPPNERSTALSIYSLGTYGGIMVGYIAGGYLATQFDWRMAFVVVGLPGIALAILFRLTVKEPPRGMSEQKTAVQKPSFISVLKTLASRPSFKHIALGCGLHAFVSYGLGNFMPLFLGRVHHMPITEIGSWLGLTSGIGGLIGIFAGGYISDKLANKTNDRTWHIKIPMYSTLLTIPFYWITFLYMDSGISATLSSLLPTMIGSMYLGPCIAMTHGLVGLRMRAVASAILFFVLNLIGLGIGPWATGMVSDLLKDTYGNESIRYAMTLMGFANLWCALHYYRATKTLEKDLNNAPD